ncbi:hypothetical protein [Coralloluteibacterium thermophilus]|uniref:RNA polymerase sigma factor 70 region 4 type 2 domain-containing protein n=1 Tax=Coralloluteibacterium thermophilum TaxID=2707049 RepID=A0ABV9NE69_9GAMM
MPPTPSAPPAGSVSPAAFAAFVRGVERRGYVFAESQCGDAARAHQALAQALVELRARAGTLALADWSLAFWARLIAQPQLRGFAAGSDAPPEADVLGAITAGPRAALLLRLVGGLELGPAARALGVSEQAYRHALARAMETLRGRADGASDAALFALRDALHARVKALPEPIRAHLAQMREDIARGRTPPAPPAAARPATSSSRRRGLLVVLWIAFAAVLLALAATFLPRERVPGLAPGVSQALPEAPLPARTLPPEAELLADPDFAMHADPDGARIAQRLDFFSWYAAEGADLATEAADASQ